jgi:hypothetical protein
MKQQTKSRFNYENLDTCILALTYIIEKQKCPECLTDLTDNDILLHVEDTDFLILHMTCPKCKFNIEHGTLLDNSPDSNDIRKEFGIPAGGE